jgi:hypothetical protein
VSQPKRCLAPLIETIGRQSRPIHRGAQLGEKPAWAVGKIGPLQARDDRLRDGEIPLNQGRLDVFLTNANPMRRIQDARDDRLRDGVIPSNQGRQDVFLAKANPVPGFGTLGGTAARTSVLVARSTATSSALVVRKPLEPGDASARPVFSGDHRPTPRRRCFDLLVPGRDNHPHGAQ